MKSYNPSTMVPYIHVHKICTYAHAHRVITQYPVDYQTHLGGGADTKHKACVYSTAHVDVLYGKHNTVVL